MRLAAVALVALPLVLAAPAAMADPDPWLGSDKAAHFAISAGIAAISYTASAQLLDARGHALVVGAGLTVTVGAGKELLDLAGYGHPSWKDFAWDVIGCIAGLAAGWGLDVAVRGLDDERPAFAAPDDRPSTGATRGGLRGAF